ncbi:hypothetical protein [Legionella micdadei]|uniref:Uncharacterized protein n=1 Tax=Legionella micdadei TaxID=451 RepID=A0A098GHL3_LEGMI|nr:hypothetical protein [Legionella micdadei]KTD27540.1 hypothetical protein Lmic_1860 [Legionella micdadei]CEG60971.1 protein of unknown function [Legionella micdadei]SCY69774.1 hypothetical protein SAMN02982997_02542 [Legionella micdadei]
MSVDLIFGRDLQGYNAYAPQFPTDIFTATLAANTAESVTVPSNFPIWIMYVRVQPNGWVWCSRTDTAAVPAGGTLTSSKSELIAGTIEYKRTVYAGDTISFLTPNTTCDIEVAFFSSSIA